MNPVAELIAILYDAALAAWEAADLRGRLSVWWYVVTHPETVNA
jgi:hypothetical protein